MEIKWSVDIKCSNIFLAKTEVTARFTCTAEWSVAEDLEMFSKSNVMTFDITSNHSIVASLNLELMKN